MWLHQSDWILKKMSYTSFNHCRFIAWSDGTNTQVYNELNIWNTSHQCVDLDCPNTIDQLSQRQLDFAPIAWKGVQLSPAQAFRITMTWIIENLHMLLFWHSREDLVPHLDLHDGSAHRRHGAHDVHAAALKGDAPAVRLPPHEIHLLVVVVHLLEKTLIGRSFLFIDSHGHPVLVYVVVVGHWEHDGNFLLGTASPQQQVIGQDTHSSTGLGSDFGEVAHLSFRRPHGGLGGAMAGATLQVNPFQERQK